MNLYHLRRLGNMFSDPYPRISLDAGLVYCAAGFLMDVNKAN